MVRGAWWATVRKSVTGLSYGAPVCINKHGLLLSAVVKDSYLVLLSSSQWQRFYLQGVQSAEGACAFNSILFILGASVLPFAEKREAGEVVFREVLNSALLPPLAECLSSTDFRKQWA